MRSPLVAACLAVLALACSTTYKGTSAGGSSGSPGGAGTDGQSDPTSGTGEIGAACGSCGSDLTCDTSVTGGYCTKKCDSPLDCPIRSKCYSFEGTNDQYCLRSCFTRNECRTGYDCKGDSGQFVCVPE